MNTTEKIYQIYGNKLKNIHQNNIIEILGENRSSFANLLALLGFNVGAEVGVESGLYSEELCKANPNIKLYSIDAWAAYGDYRNHVPQEQMDKMMADTIERIKPYNALAIKGYSLDVVKEFQDNSLDFVYLDANHQYQHVVNDMCEWYKKVKVGGILSGHDYILRRTNGTLMHVPYAVNGFVASFQIPQLFILGGKKESYRTRDRSRSWFFVKQ